MAAQLLSVLLRHKIAIYANEAKKYRSDRNQRYVTAFDLPLGYCIRKR